MSRFGFGRRLGVGEALPGVDDRSPRGTGEGLGPGCRPLPVGITCLPLGVVTQPLPFTLSSIDGGVDLVGEVDQHPRQPCSVLGLDRRGASEPLGVCALEVIECPSDRPGATASLPAERLGRPTRHPRRRPRLVHVERDVPHDHSPASFPSADTLPDAATRGTHGPEA